MEALPEAVAEVFEAKYKLFLVDFTNPILRTSRKKGAHKNKFSIRINQEYRAIYKIVRTDDETYFLWLWAGHHTIYDKLLANRKWQG